MKMIKQHFDEIRLRMRNILKNWAEHTRRLDKKNTKKQGVTAKNYEIIPKCFWTKQNWSKYENDEIIIGSNVPKKLSTFQSQN